MKGHAKIEVLELNGTPISTQEVDNLVLPTITDFLQDVANFYNTSVAVGDQSVLDQPQKQIQDVATKFNGVTKLLEATTFGLVLYNETKPVDKKGYTIGKEPMARAGKTRTATAALGTFVSTTAIKNASNVVIGNRMIWDFPAICANGTIASVALTTREFCDNTVSKKHTTYTMSLNHLPYLNSNIPPGSHPYTGIGCSPNAGEWTPGKRLASILDNADFAYVDGGAVKRDGTALSLGALPGPIYVNETDLLLTPPGFTNLLKVIDDAYMNEYIIFGTSPSGNNAVAYVNKDTQITRLTQEIPCTNALEINDWGLCGKFIILVSHTNTTITAQPVLYCVNPETNTYTTITIPNMLSSADYVYRWMRTLLTYRTIEGDYTCDFVYNSWFNQGQYSAIRYLELFISPDGNSVLTNVLNRLTDNASVDHLKLIPNYNFGVRPTTLLNCSGYSYDVNLNYIELGFARRTLFSICNLATPIVKTSTQILRVTYDLTWA